MRILADVGPMLAFGAIVIALIGWLSSRANVWSRRAGALLATIVALYAGGVALILVIGAIEAGEPFRWGGTFSVLTLGGIACAAVVSLRRPRRPMRMTSRAG
jgi:hypothetical protein